jgi:hypothetical protein
LHLISAGNFDSGSLELLCFGPKLFMYCLHHILKFYDLVSGPALTHVCLSVWVVESVGLPKFEFSPATEKVPRTIHKHYDVVSLEFVISGSRRDAPD